MQHCRALNALHGLGSAAAQLWVHVPLQNGDANPHLPPPVIFAKGLETSRCREMRKASFAPHSPSSLNRCSERRI